MEDCNRCSCTETGIWICTKIGCVEKREGIFFNHLVSLLVDVFFLHLSLLV